VRIGVPKEIKDSERRVALTPEGAATLVRAGHQVSTERDAGAGSGFADADYSAAGAELCDTARAWSAELVVKVKEPLEPEYGFFAGQIVFAYLHLAGAPRALTEALVATGTTAIAYETVEDADGRFPLLAPMSAVAGSMAPVMAAYYLAAFNGGRGALPAEMLGRRHGKAVIVGDGIVARHAARVAAALGTEVTVLGLRAELAAEFERLGPSVRFVRSTPESLAAELPTADLLVGAVLRPGGRAPHVVTEAMVKSMPAGSVIVDVSIDQGGCVATSRPTSHSDPVFVAHGVTHYCVTNMPGAYPRTSTQALTAVSLPYIRRLADGGVAAVLRDARFAKGLNVHRGRVTHRAVAASLGLEAQYVAPSTLGSDPLV
jgi:alanine dehydrogenase